MSRFRWSPIWAVLLTLLGQYAVKSLGHVTVPVIVWGEEFRDSNGANPLEKTSRANFEKFLKNRIGQATRPVLVFSMKDLCVEDIALDKIQDELKRITDGAYVYFSGVENPLGALQVLKSYNLTMEDNPEFVMNNQMVKTSVLDLKSVPNTFETVRNSSQDVIAILTGESCRFSSLERSRRAVSEPTESPESSAASTKNEIVIDPERILMYSKRGFSWKDLKNNQTIALGQPEDFKIDYNVSSSVWLSVKYSNAVANMSFYFNKRGTGYWYIDQIEVRSSGATLAIFNIGDIYFPASLSYHCSVPKTFRNKSDKSDVALSLLDLQVQVDGRNLAFSDTYDCVNFTTIPIWSGLLVTLLIGAIIMWGLTMIMDIRTMDRFDDPKGKTISITATE